MNNLNKHKIIATGNINLQEVEINPRTERLINENKETIENIWQETLKNKKLFNGALLNFCDVNKSEETIRIKGSFTEYKNFFAQIHTDLDLNIRPIGVSGVLILKEAGTEYVVFAKRTYDVTQYPGFLELVPSGSIDKEYINADKTIDYKSKLLSEFTEETGLSKNSVKDISSFALVLDTDHNVYDIGCKISLNAKKKFIEEKFKDSKEYNNPIFVAVDELSDFIKTRPDSIIPTSIALIDAYIKDNVTYQ
jgi:hypothetical protein